MGSPIIFKSIYAKLLAAAGIEFKNGVRVLSGALNPTASAVDAPAGSTYHSTLTGYVYTKNDSGSTTNWDALGPVIKDYFAVTGAPRGAQNNAGWTVTYDASTRTITFTPTGTQVIYAGSKPFSFAAPINKVHAATSPSDVYIYMDNTGTLQESATPWDLGDGNIAPMAFIRYDTTQTPNGYALFEMHGTTFMPAEHRELHEAVGTYQAPNGGAGGLTAGTYIVYSPASDATNPALASIAPGVAAITLADEDIRRVQTALADGGPYQKLQKLWTANKWVWTEDASAPYYQAANVAQYNPSSGGDTLTNLVNNDYFCVYLLRMLPTSDAASQKFRNVWVQGQVKYTPTANNDTARDAARNLALAEDFRASLDLSGLPPEYFVDAKIVCRYSTAFTNNAYRIRLAGYQKLTGSKAQAVSVAPGSILSLNDTNVNITSATAGGFDATVEVTQKLMNERLFGFDYVADWATGTAYRVGNRVLQVGVEFRAVTAHTAAAAFATDWTAGRWYALTPATTPTYTITTASGNALPTQLGRDLTVPVVGTDSAPVIAHVTPVGTVAPNDGQVYRFLGASDSATVTFVNNDAAKGFLLNGDCELGKGRMLSVQYNTGLDRYVEVSRSDIGGL